MAAPFPPICAGRHWLLLPVANSSHAQGFALWWSKVPGRHGVRVAGGRKNATGENAGKDVVRVYER